MVIHGLLALALIDHLKNERLIKYMQKYSKTAIIVYVLLILLRTAIYLKVHQMIDVVDNHGHDQGFGNFLASYITENKYVAIIVTVVLMLTFLSCLLINFWTYLLSTKLLSYAHSGDFGNSID